MFHTGANSQRGGSQTGRSSAGYHSATVVFVSAEAIDAVNATAAAKGKMLFNDCRVSVSFPTFFRCSRRVPNRRYTPYIEWDSSWNSLGGNLPRDKTQRRP